MILDRTWNKKEQKLVISYIDNLGNRQFYQKYFHHFKTYEYDDQHGTIDTWNNRKCRVVYKDTADYNPNEFDILEFMYELPNELNKVMHAQNFPKLYFFDIETKFDPTSFPDPELAAHQVTSISLVGPDMSCIVYGLRQMSEEQISLLRTRYLEWINNNEFAKSCLSKYNKEPKVLYQYFEDEKDMIKHFFTIICPKIACLAGWNSYHFDFQYLINRAILLFGRGEAYNMFRKASPTGEIKQMKINNQDGTFFKIPTPAHSVWLDYMEIVKQYDYILRPYESYSLDWVGEHAVTANKIKYNGTLNDLYEKDIEWYYYYNAIDSLIGLLIHYRLKSLESPCAVSSITLVPLLSAFGQVALTTANVFQEFYNDNKRVVYDYDSIDRYKANYDGAFCGCVPGRYNWNVCDDFASLYPSQVRTCNFSFENFITPKTEPDSLGRIIPRKWTPEELEKFRQDPNYFVSIMGNVYKNDKDYAFKRLQENLMKKRAVYKYTGQKIDSELLVEIDRLIKEKENEK